MKPLTAKAGGGDVEGGTPYLVGEKGPEIIKPKGDMEVVSADKVGSGAPQSPGASAAAKASDISEGKVKSSVTAEDDKAYLEQWKKNYAEQSVIMIAAEQKDAEDSIRFKQDRIADRSAKIKALEEIAATRELTDSEKHQLKFAESSKALSLIHI